MNTRDTVVESIDVSILQIPSRIQIATAIGKYDGIRLVVVRAHTKSGPVGMGWTNILGTGNAAEAVRAFIEGMYVPVVVGRDAHDVRALWNDLYRRSASIGRKGVAMYALAAIDIALWDVVTQTAGRALHRYFGAVHDSAVVYGAGYWMSESIDELQHDAQAHVDMGLAGVKLKIGGPIRMQEDLARVDAVRDVVGESAQVLVDANQAYDPLSAERMARELADRGVAWFEEPLVADSVSDYARLAARSPIPIACGENEYSRFGFRDLIEQRAVHILQPDVHRVGGITEFMRIVALSDTFNLPLSPHTSMELQSQLVVTANNASMMEYYDWFEPGFFTEEFDVSGGRIVPSQRPGVGARIADEALHEFSVS